MPAKRPMLTLPLLTSGMVDSDSESSLAELLRRLDSQRTSAERYGRGARGRNSVVHASSSNFYSSSGPASARSKRGNTKTSSSSSGGRPASPTSAILESFSKSSSLAEFVARSNATSVQNGHGARYKQSTAFRSSGHPLQHVQLQDYPLLFGAHRGVSPSMTPRSHLGMTESMAAVNATLRAEGSAGLTLVATARRAEPEHNTSPPASRAQPRPRSAETAAPAVDEAKLAILRSKRKDRAATSIQLWYRQRSSVKKQVLSAFAALDGDTSSGDIALQKEQMLQSEALANSSDTFLDDDGDDLSLAADDDEAAQVAADAAAFAAQEQKQKEAQELEDEQERDEKLEAAASESGDLHSAYGQHSAVTAEEVIYNPEEEHLHYVGDKHQLPERFVQDELERKRVEEERAAEEEREKKRIEREKLDKESFEIFNASTDHPLAGRRAISSRERGDLNPSSRYHVEHFGAREQLTALLQGFVVRNILVQKYCQDLVHQIKDTNSVLTSSLADPSALPDGFALQLSNQSRLLKRNLIECFGPPRRALRFQKTEQELALYREIERKRKEEYAKQDMENQARLVKLMHQQNKHPAPKQEDASKTAVKQAPKPFLRRKKPVKIAHKKVDYSKVQSRTAIPKASPAKESPTAAASTDPKPIVDSKAAEAKEAADAKKAAEAKAAGEKKAAAEKRASEEAAEMKKLQEAEAVKKSRADAAAYEAQKNVEAETTKPTTVSEPQQEAKPVAKAEADDGYSEEFDF